jgi:hypothetical protein
LGRSSGLHESGSRSDPDKPAGVSLRFILKLE